MRRMTVMIVVEWCVAILFIFLFFSGGNSYVGSVSAKQAHELSERSYHYGPSKVVREVPFGDDITIYLGKYKNWFSADTVIRRTLGWYPGGGVNGVEIDHSKPLTYSYSISQHDKKLSLAQFYGYVTDSEITTVVLNTEIKEIEKSLMSQVIKEDRMFLFL